MPNIGITLQMLQNRIFRGIRRLTEQRRLQTDYRAWEQLWRQWQSRAYLEAALEIGIGSIAFCCISTGEFHFPNDKAAQIAVETVREFQRTNTGRLEVVFNVFKDIDYEIYREILTQD